MPEQATNTNRIQCHLYRNNLDMVDALKKPQKPVQLLIQGRTCGALRPAIPLLEVLGFSLIQREMCCHDFVVLIEDSTNLIKRILNDSVMLL